MPVDLDLAGPANDNRRALMQRATQRAPEKGSGGVVEGSVHLHHRVSHVPQATGFASQMNIIQDAGHGGRDRVHGIPGIISTTSLGPDQRSRLLSGIIDMSHPRPHDEGILHKISGHDATAMNAGMRPIPGAPIHSDRRH